jgi:4-amino-4-deoxy-L-arabinose transferase-like glycosyltransferase
MLLLLLLTLLSWGLGRKFSRILKIPYSTLSEEFPFATSLGLGVLSLIILILGAARLFYPAAIYITTLVLLILTLKELREIVSEISDCRKRCGEFKSNIPQITLFSLIVITIAILLAGTFTPPISYDGLAYHLGVPKIYIKEHGIIPLPYHVYSNFPFNMEMLFAYSILLTGNEILAKMFHFLTAILTCFALYSFGKKYLNREIGLLSAVVFINIPLVGHLSSLCYNDLGLTLFIFLAFFAFINWSSSSEEEKPRWLLLCGILTGLAIGTKFSAVIFLFVFLSLSIAIESAFNKTHERRIRRATKNLAIFAGLTFCAFLPWMVKNAIITGNPVFPFLLPVFSGGNWDMSRYQRFATVHLPTIFTPKEFFLQIWTLLPSPMLGLPFVFVFPIAFLLKKISARPPANGLLASFIAGWRAGLHQANGNARIKIFVIYAIYYYVIWFFFSHRVDRFILPLYAFLSLIVAYTVFNLPKNLKILTGCFLGIFMVFNLLLLIMLSESIGAGAAFSGIENKEEYLEEKLYYYPAISYINNELPDSSKILFIGDNQTYYCEKPLLSNSPLDRSIIVETVRNSKDSKEVKDNLRAMGITHIYYNASEVKRTQETYSAFDWKGQEEYTFINFMENYTKKLFEKNGCFIFEIK